MYIFNYRSNTYSFYNIKTNAEQDEIKCQTFINSSQFYSPMVAPINCLALGRKEMALSEGVMKGFMKELFTREWAGFRDSHKE